MNVQRKGRFYWTSYRKYFVRDLLAKGLSRSVIAERMGITRDNLNASIIRHDLTRPNTEPMNEPTANAR